MSLSITLIVVPPFLALLDIPYDSTIVGSNSFAIAAACHVSPIVGGGVPTASTRSSEMENLQSDGGIELRRLIEPSPSRETRYSDCTTRPSKTAEERRIALREVAQSKIRWSVVKMPEKWTERLRRKGSLVEHTSFGVEEDEVDDPVEGHWYA